IEIDGARVLTNNHAFVNSRSRSDKQRAAFLQVVKRIGCCLTHAIGDERTGRASAQWSLPFAPTKKHRVQQTRSLRLRQKLIAKSDQPARRRLKLQTNAP